MRFLYLLFCFTLLFSCNYNNQFNLQLDDCNCDVKQGAGKLRGRHFSTMDTSLIYDSLQLSLKSYNEFYSEDMKQLIPKIPFLNCIKYLEVLSMSRKRLDSSFLYRNSIIDQDSINIFFDLLSQLNCVNELVIIGLKEDIPNAKKFQRLKKLTFDNNSSDDLDFTNIILYLGDSIEHFEFNYDPGFNRSDESEQYRYHIAKLKSIPIDTLVINQHSKINLVTVRLYDYLDTVYKRKH